MNRFKKYSIYTLTSLAILLFAFLIWLYIFNIDQIALGIKLDKIEIGSKTKSEARQIIKKEIDGFLTQEITLKNNQVSWQTNFNKLGINLDEESTISRAYKVGHGNNILVNLKEQIQALFGKYNISPTITINEDAFKEGTQNLFSDFEKPVSNASLYFNQEIGDFSILHSEDGKKIDKENLRKKLINRAKSLTVSVIVLEVRTIEPEIKNDEVQSAREKANQILANQPYYLKIEDIVRTVSRKTLLDWIEFKPKQEKDSDNQILGFSLNYEKVENSLDDIAKTIDRPYSNAELETRGKWAIKFRREKKGYEVKRQQTFDKFINNLLHSPPIKTTYIIADTAYPEITLQETNQLGINRKIGSGNSNFSGSPNNRIHNIKIATNKFEGLILEPEEEFSFNEILGEVDKENGFLPELVIKDGRLIAEYGGGVCQVSTTLFRAVVNSGLDVTERQSHSFPVEYYNPQGFDATVYSPRPDFKFINNTPQHLMIYPEVSGHKLFFRIYGTDDDRKIEVKGPYILEKKEDGSMKTVLYQNVYNQENEQILKETFFSNYDSPAKYHTKPKEE